MFLAMNRKIRQDDHGTAFSSLMICLLSALVMTAAGCASAPLFRTNPELPQRKNAIRSVGLLPAMIIMYEEQYRFGRENEVVPHDDWSKEAAESIRRAFIAEVAAGGLPLTVIGGEDQELNDMADLFSAVDLSIQGHVYGVFDPGSPTHIYGESEGHETFPEKTRTFDYSLGPAMETMERHHVDAVWIITGFNLVPTTGARVGDMVEAIVGTLRAMGRGSGPMILKSIELRAALVDKSGAVLFYCKLGGSDGRQAGQNADQFYILKGEQKPGQTSEGAPLNFQDIRDPKTARSYVGTLLSEYRKAVAK